MTAATNSRPSTEAIDTVAGSPLIRWCGYYEAEDASERRLIFKMDDNVKREVSAGVALETGMFDLPTSSPQRRDALRAWAEDPRMDFPPYVPAPGSAESRTPSP